MHFNLLIYFYKFIFFNKTRQQLIFLAVAGLLISSFSLTVLQGIMGGLQNGLITRSKNVLGQGHIDIDNLSREDVYKLSQKLDDEGFKFVPELELELMVQNENYISPIILHGMDFKKYIPRFLQNKDLSGVVVGSDLGREIRSFFGSKIIFTSPSHLEVIFREIPLQGIDQISEFYSSELPEIDRAHGWVRLSFLQNMIRKRKYNRLRIYQGDLDQIPSLIANYGVRFITWEQQNATLVYALNLETRVMLFLFIGASFLVGICITSGFLIFYNKVKIDLASYWILGLSKKELFKLIYGFGQSLTVICCLLGVALGVGFLVLLKQNHFVIMPDHFVERNIPVKLDVFDWLLAFFVPYLVSSIFTHLTFKSFKKENYSFISLIKRVG